MSSERLNQRIDEFSNAVAQLRKACEQPNNEFIRLAMFETLGTPAHTWQTTT